MAIIVSKNGKDAERIEPSQFDYEDDLQQYVSDNPDVVPIYDIDEDINLLIVARELQTTSGPIDAFGIDQNGDIYLIETKLFKNSDKRKVVAQVLDYGASLWKTSVDFDQFLLKLDSYCQDNFNCSVRDKIQNHFEMADEELEVLLEKIKVKLNGGVFSFVVLMDQIERRLKDLILFINQNSQFDVYAVELDYYKHDETEIVIPKLHGAEVKKDVTSNKQDSSNSEACDEETFLTILKKGDFDGSAITVEQALNIHKLNQMMLKISGGRVEYYRSTRKGEDYAKSFYIDDKYNFEFESNCMITFFPYEKTTTMVNIIREVYAKTVEAGLFGKDESTIDSPRYYITPNQMDNSDEIGKFIELYEQVLKKA
jgi:hypothetical protein